MDFQTAFQLLIGNEGGYSLDPHDRGNWTGGAINVGECKGTKYGISAAQFPAEDIANLTLDRAAQLYKSYYWGPAGCDLVPDSIKFDLFDIAVNSGVKRAIKVLQQAAGLSDREIDGVIGPTTMTAVANINPATLDRRFNGARLHFLTSINDEEWTTQGRGLVNRVANNLMGVA